MSRAGSFSAERPWPLPLPGPPYPDPVNNQAVYDYAGILSSTTIVSAESTIDAIEARTGAEVAVYTQVKPESDTIDKANADAAALIDQWGIGRRGFDDSLVIMFDLDLSLRHGQVALYAGAGYKAAFLSDEDRQTIFDDDMLPRLRVADMDGALLAALAKVDANATPEHAAALERGRQINAVIVVAGVMVGTVLLLIAFLRWFVRGRDPFFLDDPSIFMPAPPAGLTPAMATLLMDQKASKRSIAAALVDLAAGGAIAFREEKLEGETSAGIEYRAEAGASGPAEARLLQSIRRWAEGYEDYISPARMYELSDAVGEAKEILEKEAVKKGWLVEAPSAVKLRWGVIAGTELVLAAFVGFFWLIFPVSFLFALMGGLAIAGAATAFLTPVMPARTRRGAQLKVMLGAYGRTLVATLRQSRSLDEVVARRPLPWITTPDQALAWGIALGLNDELVAVLARSQAAPGVAGAAAASGVAAGSNPAWSPSWWTPAAAESGGGQGGGHGGGPSSGLFSSTPFPDPGAVFAALGSLASPPSPPSSGGSSYSSSSGSSSGGSSFSSSSGGGFSGGSSSGGGGSGGGF